MNSFVYLYKCEEYRTEEIYRYVKSFFNKGNNLDRIKPGVKVLIKPNLCLMESPEKAITTNPVLIEQIIRVILEKGAIPIIGESPIGIINCNHFSDLLKVTGIEEVAKRWNCRCVLLGTQQKVLNINIHGIDYDIPVSNEYLEADYIINVPKFKTHGLMGFTGAIKNIFGIVMGKYKACMHSYAHNVEEFAELLVKIYSIRLPDLTIMDAIDGLEGNGPGARGIKRKISYLMISNDGLLVDALSTKMIGLNTQDVLTNHYASIQQIGNLDTDEFYYNDIAQKVDINLTDFVLPDIYKSNRPELKSKVYDILKYRIKIDYSKCKSCLLCHDNCPQKCLEFDGSSLYIDNKKCILCLCCQEICPEGAIDISRVNFYFEIQKKAKPLSNL